VAQAAQQVLEAQLEVILFLMLSLPTVAAVAELTLLTQPALMVDQAVAQPLAAQQLEMVSSDRDMLARQVPVWAQMQTQIVAVVVVALVEPDR
jgi:hypothetical protein